jgi:hypothetical protein
MIYADRQQLVAALVLLVSALFVSVRLVKPHYRARMRWISIATFLVALGIVVVWIAVWLVGLVPPPDH